MKTKLVTSIDDVSKVPVYIGTKNKGWAFFLDMLTLQPIFVYVGTRYYTIKKQLIEFVNEIGSKVEDNQQWIEAAERLENKDEFDVFNDDCEGQATYFNKMMIVCLRPNTKRCTILHECTHLSQFLLMFKYGDSDFNNATVRELQANLVETYTTIVEQVYDILKKRKF